MEFTDVVMMTYKQLISEAHELRHLRSNEHDNVKWRVITDRLMWCKMKSEVVTIVDCMMLKSRQQKQSPTGMTSSSFVKQRSN